MEGHAGYGLEGRWCRGEGERGRGRGEGKGKAGGHGVWSIEVSTQRVFRF